MIDFFLLDESCVYGDHKLNAFNYGYLDAEVSDYAEDNILHKKDVDDVSYGDWWLNSKNNRLFGSIVNSNNSNKLNVRLSLGGYGIRPAVMFDDIAPFITSVNDINEDVMEVTFGNYPQTHVEYEISNIMETLYKLDALQEVSDNLFKFKERLASKANYKSLWSYYEPIVWVVDKKTGIAFTKKIIDCGKNGYHKAEKFLKDEFIFKALPSANIVAFNKVKRYNELLRRKKALESELKELENEIFVLKRKKNKDE